MTEERVVERAREHLRRLCVDIVERPTGSSGNQAATGYLADVFSGLGCDVVREQLMPKSFTYYNPEEHRRIVSALEAARPAVVIAATGRDPVLASGLSPYPLLEDGDVDMPSLYLTEAEGERLARFEGRTVRVTSDARRVASWGCNVVATHGAGRARRVVVCAHVAAKLGTPGALDDAAGVVTLLLLAQLLGRGRSLADGDVAVEFVAMNGEDHYANPGERA